MIDSKFIHGFAVFFDLSNSTIALIAYSSNSLGIQNLITLNMNSYSLYKNFLGNQLT